QSRRSRRVQRRDRREAQLRADCTGSAEGMTASAEPIDSAFSHGSTSCSPPPAPRHMLAEDISTANRAAAPARTKESTDMPEGHVIHRLARDLVDTFAGHRIASSSPQGRFSGADLLDGDVLESAEAWGKHLFVGFASTAAQVHIHL